MQFVVISVRVFVFLYCHAERSDSVVKHLLILRGAQGLSKRIDSRNYSIDFWIWLIKLFCALIHGIPDRVRNEFFSFALPKGAFLSLAVVGCRKV